MVMKHFQEKKIEAQRAAKASEMHQKRITGFIAKMIKTFWNNVEKVSSINYCPRFSCNSQSVSVNK